ncbi:MAG: hypothetical protein PHP75_04410 [Methylacidiphilaceae bacterium]|nr:hypothetical protein [Candidatus Methylacidiphilaceae bacterium]
MRILIVEDEEKIGPHALHGRVEIPSEDPDLARLAQILNAMWERIGEAHCRGKQVHRAVVGARGPQFCPDPCRRG